MPSRMRFGTDLRWVGKAWMNKSTVSRFSTKQKFLKITELINIASDLPGPRLIARDFNKPCVCWSALFSPIYLLSFPKVFVKVARPNTWPSKRRIAMTLTWYVRQAQNTFKFLLMLAYLDVIIYTSAVHSHCPSPADIRHHTHGSIAELTEVACLL